MAGDAVETLILQYQSSADELARAQAAHSPAVRLSSRRTRLLGVALLVLGLVYLVFSPALALAPLAVGVLLVGLSTSWSIRRRTAWVLARVPALLDPITLAADQRGVRVSSATSDMWFAWSHYEAVVADDEGVALVLRGGGSVRWVPVRAFGGTEQQAAWCRQLTTWMVAARG